MNELKNENPAEKNQEETIGETTEKQESEIGQHWTAKDYIVHLKNGYSISEISKDSGDSEKTIIIAIEKYLLNKNIKNIIQDTQEKMKEYAKGFDCGHFQGYLDGQKDTLKNLIEISFSEMKIEILKYRKSVREYENS